jgi:hypothetical protein
MLHIGWDVLASPTDTSKPGRYCEAAIAANQLNTARA